MGIWALAMTQILKPQIGLADIFQPSFGTLEPELVEAKCPPNLIPYQDIKLPRKPVSCIYQLTTTFNELASGKLTKTK